MYKNELDLGEDVDNGVEIYKKAAQILNNITILGAGEHPSIFLPEELTINQKKMLYKLLQNCNKETQFKIAVVFIDKNGEFKEPLYVDEYGDLSSIESINSFIDLYLGRYSTQEIPVFLEKDLQLNQHEREDYINL